MFADALAPRRDCSRGAFFISLLSPDAAEVADLGLGGGGGEWDAVVDGLGEDEGWHDDGAVVGGHLNVRLIDVDAERNALFFRIERRAHGGDGKVGVEVGLAAIGTTFILSCALADNMLITASIANVATFFIIPITLLAFSPAKIGIFVY